MIDLHAIVKAYDVRGLVATELTPEVVWRLGAAAAQVLAKGRTEFAIGHDMRPSSPGLAGAFSEGVRSQGIGVIDVGLASTDELYYASGTLDVPAAMFTASHNPPEYNGIKLCGPGAAPVSIDHGLAEIRDLAQQGMDPSGVLGGLRSVDLLADFAAHVRSFIDVDTLRPMTVAVDAGNGMAGLVVPAVFDALPIEVVPLFFELDGTFPNHPANPLEPANLVDLQRAVVSGGLPLGMAFDGDADRMFAVDERGRPVPSSLITAVVADRVLARSPGATILYNLICSRTVPETIEAAGGVAVRTRVGHSFIKAEMARTGAVFAGEHSGHYYFRDNFGADSGLIAALMLLQAVAIADAPLSAVVAPYDRYAASGELNFRVTDVVATIDRLRDQFADAKQDTEDGLTVVLGDGWFNLRPSNTEPLLRLNAEGDDVSAMERIRDQVTATVVG